MGASFLAYYSILITVVCLSRYYNNRQRIVKYGIGYALPVVFASIILGGRYETGTDWPNYKAYYDTILYYDISYEDVFESKLEPLYMLLNKVVAITGLGSSFLFSTISCINITLLYILFREKKQILPIALFFYLIGNLFLSINIVRQSLAMSFIYLSLKYLERNRISFLIICFVAICFHYSALVFLPMYFINHKKFAFLDNYKIVVVLYLLTFVLAQPINIIFAGFIQAIGFNEKYSENADNLSQQMVLTSGYGLVVKHILNIMLIYFWNILFKRQGIPFFSSAYRITILGFFLANIFGISVFLSRVSLYFTGFSFIAWSIIMYNMFNYRRFFDYRFVAVGIIILYIALFSAAIINGNGGCSPYQFKWI